MGFSTGKIAELYPEAEEMMIQPMLIHNATDTQLREACEGGNFFGQLKKDGSLYMYAETPTYSYLFGRTVSKKTGLLTEKSANVPHIVKALSESLPSNTLLLGEIYYPGKSSKDTTSIMGCLPKKAIERQEGEYGKIHYYIHDILMYNGINFITAETSNLVRYNVLEKIYHQCGLDQYDFLELAEKFEDDLYEHLVNALDSGEEGMVFKQKDGIYEPGKRPMTNYKAKKVDYADVIIIGFKPPIKEYTGKELDSWEFNISEDSTRLQGTHRQLEEAGMNPIPVTKAYYYQWVNSRLEIGAYNDEGELFSIGTISSGISDEMKEDMSKNPEDFLNKVCAVQMMEKDRYNKTVRHCFFKFIREDKNEEDCLIRNIF